MEREKISLGLQGIDDKFVVNAVSGKKRHWTGRTISKVAMVACCALLMGAGVNVLVLELTGGNIFEWSNHEKQGYTYQETTTADEVYQEREDGLFYIFEGTELDISEYCNENDYFLSSSLDKNGTGYIVAVGGEKGERGFLLKHIQQGKLLIGHGSSEIYGGEVTLLPNEDVGVASSFPQLTWNHHATHFIGDTIPENWLNSPQIIRNEFGVGEKISKNFYSVKGENVGFYTAQEQLNYVSTEAPFQLEWLSGIAGSFIEGSTSEDITLSLGVFDEKTDQREAELREFLDKLGFNYSLQFME